MPKYGSSFCMILMMSSLLSCKCPDNIHFTHLGFYDSPSEFYVTGDTARRRSLSHLSIYFLATESNDVCITMKKMKDFLDTSAVLISKKKSFYRLQIVFFKSSETTNRLQKEQRKELMLYCNDDITAEFEYEEGRSTIQYRYLNGRIVN